MLEVLREKLSILIETPAEEVCLTCLLMLTKCMHCLLSDAKVNNFVIIESIYFHELWEEHKDLRNILRNCELSKLVETLNQKFTLVSDETGVVVLCINFHNFMINQVITNDSWFDLVDFLHK